MNLGGTDTAGEAGALLFNGCQQGFGGGGDRVGQIQIRQNAATGHAVIRFPAGVIQRQLRQVTFEAVDQGHRGSHVLLGIGGEQIPFRRGIGRQYPAAQQTRGVRLREQLDQALAVLLALVQAERVGGVFQGTG